MTYEDIIKELNQNIFSKNKNQNIDERLNFDMLFNYIRGKNIMCLIEEKNNINQQGILETRDFFDESTDNVIRINEY